jgi:hypothetical protein
MLMPQWFSRFICRSSLAASHTFAEVSLTAVDSSD